MQSFLVDFPLVQRQLNFALVVVTSIAKMAKISLDIVCFFSVCLVTPLIILVDCCQVDL